MDLLTLGEYNPLVLAHQLRWWVLLRVALHFAHVHLRNSRTTSLLVVCVTTNSHEAALHHIWWPVGHLWPVGHPHPVLRRTSSLATHMLDILICLQLRSS